MYLDLTIQNYKCFRHDASCITELKPINILIGRNNTGKSAFMEILTFLAGPQEHALPEARPEVSISVPLLAEHIVPSVPANHSGGGIPGANHQAHCLTFVGKPMTFRPSAEGKVSLLSAPDGFPGQYVEIVSKNVAATANPLSGYVVRRIAAERDMVREQVHSYFGPTANGGLLTTAINLAITEPKYPAELVPEILLPALNQIMGQDGYFDAIVPIISEGQWEVGLMERGKGRIPISASGSGLKTILQVLFEVIAYPVLAGISQRPILFLFEELENNLHPGIQRRLLDFLFRSAQSMGATFVLATHSGVALDMLRSHPESQLLQITQSNSASQISTPGSRTQLYGTLDELGARASDILQANGVIWVEGPSDRVYINAVINVLSSGLYVEGIHYQVMFYGGKLLSHLTVDGDVLKFIDVVSINHNVAIVMDRDTKTINATKQRLVSEVTSFGGTAWVSEGTEIEFDIPEAVLAAVFADWSTTVGKIPKTYANYLTKRSALASLAFASGTKKVEFASVVVAGFTAARIGQNTAMRRLGDSLCESIGHWNGLSISDSVDIPSLLG